MQPSWVKGQMPLQVDLKYRSSLTYLGDKNERKIQRNGRDCSQGLSGIYQRKNRSYNRRRKDKTSENWKIKSYGPPQDYTPERTTVWSFPDRGDWATHKGNYRGNWSPYIPRNLILKCTEKGDWVLDQMMGSGTTLVEAKLLERNAIGG